MFQVSEKATEMIKEHFKDKVLRLNESNPGFSYAYGDGVLYHQHGDK